MKEKKTILLSGYFIGIERKKKLIDHYPDKVVLEGSYSNSHKYYLFKKPGVYYCSQLCIGAPLIQLIKAIFNPKFWNIKFDQRELKTLYKRECYTSCVYRLKRFKIINSIPFLLSIKIPIKRLLLKFKRRLFGIDNLSKINDQNRRFWKRSKTGSILHRSYKSTRRLYNRWIFIMGYRYNLMIINYIYDKYDISATHHWGPYTSLNTVFRRLSKKYLSDYTTVEYGEIPGTYSFNKIGMFDKSDFHRKLNNISKIRRLNLPKKHTVEYISKHKEDLEQSQSSTKSLPINGINNSLVIYVNGVESVLSNLIFTKSNTLRVNPNEKLLKTILSVVDDDVLILYREHPLTYKNSPALLCDKKIFENKNILDVSKHPLESTILISDIVISMPSKVQIDALLLDRKLISIGKTIFPEKFNVQNLTITRNIYELNGEDINNSIKKSIQESNYDISYINMISHLTEYNEKSLLA